mmetsp:Transcript_20862/g.43311  ORF Transcript_20862/g.43311 Transcript_20862/m.43311 type:complete len:171 (+) Transcript_20862:1-513(+)
MRRPLRSALAAAWAALALRAALCALVQPPAAGLAPRGMVAPRAAAAPAAEGGIAQGRLPAQLVEGVLRSPGNFQQRFLEGFLRSAGEQWLVGEDTNLVDETTREVLVSRVEAFQAQGAEQISRWDAYCEQELGCLMGDPCAFDLSILILNPSTKRKVRRAARGALMGGLL